MKPSIKSTQCSSDNSLLSLPTEILTRIYAILSSIEDVLTFSLTCARLRKVWLTNQRIIYQRVGPRAIPCESHARRFLAEQKGVPSEALTISHTDVIRMVHNSHIVERAIQQFEILVVPHVKTGIHDVLECYGAEARRHPDVLTRTERSRFTRSYYQLWAMLKLHDPVRWQARLNTMRLKELCHLYEMSQLPDSFGGGEETLPPPRFPIRNPNPTCVYDVFPTKSEERIMLEKMILKHLNETYKQTHEGERMDGIWANSGDEGYYGFMVIWDHWQSSLKEVICNIYSRRPPLNKGYNWDLWDESSDEEV